MSTRSRIAALRRGRAITSLAVAGVSSFTTVACAPAPGAAGARPAAVDGAAGQRCTDREAIEHVLSKANIGFELSDPHIFAYAFAEDAVYELASAARAP